MSRTTYKKLELERMGSSDLDFEQLLVLMTLIPGNGLEQNLETKGKDTSKV